MCVLRDGPKGGLLRMRDMGAERVGLLGRLVVHKLAFSRRQASTALILRSPSLFLILRRPSWGPSRRTHPAAPMAPAHAHFSTARHGPNSHRTNSIAVTTFFKLILKGLKREFRRPNLAKKCHFSLASA